MNHKTLIVLTSKYPYGTGEEFLENECENWIQYSHIIVLAVNVSKDDINKQRVLPFENMNIDLIPFNCTSIRDKSFLVVFNILLEFFTFSFWRELFSLISSKRFNKKTFASLLRYAYYLAIGKFCINKNKEKFIGIDEAIIYSYWSYLQPSFGIYLSKWIKKSIQISRAHGFDLYLERNIGNYIPYRDFVFSKLSKIFSVSNNGQEYLMNHYSIYKNKFELSRLGTVDCGKGVDKSNEEFHILSCSHCIRLKRVDLILEAIENIDDIDIIWDHFGDGTEFNNLLQKANMISKPNLSINFHGALSHDRLIEEYKNTYYDLFINVSTSEGVPVSIMEALSFGIPVLATDVGGTSEIVINGFNGYLLEPHINSIDLASEIRKVFNLSSYEKKCLRSNAREVWLERCNAKKNYQLFFNRLEEIFDGGL